jgi:hypothetical protein
VGTARTLQNTSYSDTFAQKTSQNRKLQRPADLCATCRRPSPTTAVAKAIDETSTPRLGGAPSQSPLLCGPLFAPATHEEVAFFGEHRPGGIPSSSESPCHLIQVTRSMKNGQRRQPAPTKPASAKPASWSEPTPEADATPVQSLQSSVAASERTWPRWHRRR